jgi:hypothetical protein
MRFFDLRVEPSLINGHALRVMAESVRGSKRAPVHTIRKRHCTAVGRQQMIVVQDPGDVEAGSTARSGSYQTPVKEKNVMFS